MREIRATHAETAERYFTCGHCGARGEVAFRALGESGWHSEGLLVDDAAERARAAAEADLMVDAERVLGLIRCPTCGRRDPGFERWAWIRPGAWFVLAGGAFVVAGMHAMIAGAVLAIVGCGQAWREWSRFRRADRALLLRLQPGKPPARPASKPRSTPARPLAPPPQLPPARAITAPPIAPVKTRGPDEEPAFLRTDD